MSKLWLWIQILMTENHIHCKTHRFHNFETIFQFVGNTHSTYAIEFHAPKSLMSFGCSLELNQYKNSIASLSYWCIFSCVVWLWFVIIVSYLRSFISAKYIFHLFHARFLSMATFKTVWEIKFQFSIWKLNAHFFLLNEKEGRHKWKFQNTKTNMNYKRKCNFDWNTPNFCGWNIFAGVISIPKHLIN